MTGERAKRFPLGLADLVREPRKRDAGPLDARAAKSTSAAGAVKPVGVARSPALSPKPLAAAKPGVVAKPAAATSPRAARPAAAKSAQPIAIKTRDAGTPQGTVSTKPQSAARPRGASVASLAGAPKKAAGAASLLSKPVRAVGVGGARATPAGAPNVALNGALALTSERVRERMVERLRANGIADSRVLNAMSVVPRHMFVDPGLATQAYEDAALPIGHHQTISKPSVVARMIELAAAGRPLVSVLEIGTGCGYQAAVLSQVAREVYSIERIKPLYERAKTNLRPLRIPNIRLHYGDGRLGLPAAAPFDAIVIAAAGLDVPQALLDQLAIGGRLVAPVAEQGAAGAGGAQGESAQVLTLVERTGPAQWREVRLDRVFFVPLKSGVI
ncbi:protein-L-isoaspartate(D-aspartate) O-methyltransferase [Paraburkholderia kururiensis]|uniref:protein-L-isoaspartate(D-aspartate) O-methyltransferase n=1 Tax=Paraburkholderia kururiensis TaxID=984307 RepID=UPI0018F52396|nr:protein-L-isoaspartate(D-aspartate) O-methyltransferase [Paraburkholderia kururiensis]